MVFAIADLHFDSTGEKPMGIFGKNWIGHEEKIIESWKDIVTEEDLVLLPGDISWALKLEEAYYDLKIIDELPGKKIMIKGNHDYWWNSLKKINDLNFKSIDFIQNNSFRFEDIAIVGTRGWRDLDIEYDIDISAKEKAQDEKIFKRELHRLNLSLDSIRGSKDKIICMLHYPPFDDRLEPNDFGDLMEKYGVDICLYGHLHGDGHRFAVEGKINGVNYHCVASDYIDFIPKKII